eukprot:TRINITY_DN77_c0_g2_i1.p1 TRINITY_DN77_c0_g2~~TRINITY_DN77_c0_g2_i1.p1  ORF type:complete len:190 (+),score=74.40 TRINITY_DN77_c0_g2_i1:406-975(+)
MFEYESDYEEDEDEEEEVILPRATVPVQCVNELFGMFEYDKKWQDEEGKYDDYKEETGLFCFCCGSKWMKHHICDNSFRGELCEILANAEPKKIGKVDGVPSIRCCPKCCQLLYHIDCCKHMRCKGCKTDFCHVCLKMKKDSAWQCGSSGTICDIAEIQNMLTLPDNVVITKTQFRAFDEIEVRTKGIK